MKNAAATSASSKVESSKPKTADTGKSTAPTGKADGKVEAFSAEELQKRLSQARSDAAAEALEAAISSWEEPRPPGRARRGWDDAPPRRSRSPPPRDREVGRASRWGDDGAGGGRRDEGEGGGRREEGELAEQSHPDPERVEAAKKVAEEIKDSLAKRSEFDPKDLSKQIGTKHMGVAIHWSNARGFGILRTQAHGEVFVHAKSLLNCTELAIGDVVTFELGYDRKRQKAEALNCQKAGVGGYKEPEHFPRNASSSGMDGDTLSDAAEAAAKKLMAGRPSSRSRSRDAGRL